MHSAPHNPQWFFRKVHPFTNEPYYEFNQKYWKVRERQGWEETFDLF